MKHNITFTFLVNTFNKKRVIYLDFINQQTTQTAKALLGVKIIYQDDYQTYTGYIVETEAYLGIQDKAAHGFGGKITPKVTSLYKKVARYMHM